MPRIRHIYSIMQVTLFFTLISLVMANDLLHFYRPPGIFVMEKRAIRKRPVPDFTNLDAFPRDYTPYFNDCFPFRAGLIGFYAMARYRYFHQSPYPARVEFGRDGWMFFTAERPYFENTVKMPDSDIEKIVAEIHLRAAWYQSKGIRFYFAVPPVKADIYPEYVPRSYVKRPGPGFLDKVTQLLRRDTLVRYIDLKSALLAAKKHGQLHYKTDNHWNALGGYVGYRALMERMKQDFPALTPLDTTEFVLEKKVVKGMNMAELVNISDHVTDLELVPHLNSAHGYPGMKRGYKPRPGFGYPAEFETVFRVDDPALPILLVVRDSYFYGLMPYFTENFSKSVILYDTGVYGIFDDAVRAEKPDLVLYLIFEPHLPNLIGVDL